MTRKQLEIEPEKFRPNIKVHKIFRAGGQKLGSVGFPETTNVLGLTAQTPLTTIRCGSVLRDISLQQSHNFKLLYSLLCDLLSNKSTQQVEVMESGLKAFHTIITDTIRL